MTVIDPVDGWRDIALAAVDSVLDDGDEVIFLAETWDSDIAAAAAVSAISSTVGLRQPVICTRSHRQLQTAAFGPLVLSSTHHAFHWQAMWLQHLSMKSRPFKDPISSGVTPPELTALLLCLWLVMLAGRGRHPVLQSCTG